MRTEPSTRAPGTMSFMRLSERRNVDLPQPDGPMSAVTWFGKHVERRCCSSTRLAP